MYSYPYEMFAVTVDCAIFRYNQEGRLEVLMVERRDDPYKGCYALPGGFVNAKNEKVYDALIREIKEETNIDLSNRVVRNVGFYDSPDRDKRGRVITFAYTLFVDDGFNLNEKAGDDAASVKWVYAVDILTGDIKAAFDHKEIISDSILAINDYFAY